MSTNESTSTVAFSPLALPAWTPLAEALAQTRDDGERAKKASAKFTAAKTSVTERIVAFAAALRETGQPVTMDARDKGTTQATLYDAMCGYAKKSQASKMASLTCWLALRPDLEGVCVAGKGERGETLWLGYNAAHAAVAAIVEPKPRDWRAFIADLSAEVQEGDDALKARLALIPVEEAIRLLNSYFLDDVARPEASGAMQRSMLDAMRQSSVQAAAAIAERELANA